ncbi:major capsid protein [Vibrio phage 1.262.O._10N.286.51.A9]|nr:major capsid protein [Vibrio phage 1.262.O._10N.286.51.A9]
MAEFNTLDSVGTREDLADVIYNVDPFETPVMNSIGRGSASQKYWDWQADDNGEGSATDTRVQEGHDFSTTAQEPTDRLSSIQQINERAFGVTGTQEASKHAGRGSEMAYQMAKVSKKLKMDMEMQLAGGHHQYADAATITDVRVTPSISSWLSQNVVQVDPASASVLGGNTPTPTLGISNGRGVWAEGGIAATEEITEDHLQDLLTDIYMKSGKSPSTLVVDPRTKTKISNTFVGRATGQLQQSAKDKTVQSVVDVYISDFGTLRIMPSRYIGGDLANGGMALALDTSAFSIDFLRSFNTYDLPKIGDYERKALNVEWGLRSNNELSSGMIIDFAKGNPIASVPVV